ncbi:MAG: DUF4192 domain-containing protein [Geodermatophilaceae bacterium]|nr:DUF4192 domain-containing protein [Geodermatophilaceae bacterium]
MSRRSASRAKDAPAIRLRSPAQIVAAIPYLVGFHPSESLVAVGLGSEAPRVCLTVRVDLPPADCSHPLAQLLATHLRHAEAGGVFLVIFTEETGEPPRPDLVTALEEATGEMGIEVRDALWVRSGRWRSYRCRAPQCCPPGGTPVDAGQVSELAAAAAFLGDVVHGSREDLERALEPVGPLARAALDQTFERVRRQFMSELPGRGRDVVGAESRALLMAAVQARAESAAELSAAEVARLALGLSDVLVRDSALTWAGTDLEHAAEAVWVELVRKATSPYDAPAATLLAVHAYLRGNGAYARIALDRALASDPAYSFALLLVEGLDRGVPPKALRAALTRNGRAA